MYSIYILYFIYFCILQVKDSVRNKVEFVHGIVRYVLDEKTVYLKNRT